ncbi:MAG: putative peptidoglycan glycosyltransferase FtsW [Coriobacteriales bacterium]|nr:putative peptidoglycan glycosyltransferase FtsW [Coriobacteriales bacterium]
MSSVASRLSVVDGRKATTERSRGGRLQAHFGGVAPSVLFVGTALGLLVFGMLMIYSSSSISGLMSEDCGNDPAYYLVRQIVFAGAGLLVATGFACVDYHRWLGKPLHVMWGVTIVALVLVYTPLAGQDINGASRWIGIGPFTLQPSEFAKISVLLIGATLWVDYFDLGAMDSRDALKHFGIGIAIPLALVLWQPDKGTTGVIALTLIIMAFLCGVPGRKLAIVFLVLGVFAIAYALKDDYSRARVLTMFNPFLDEDDKGYQLVQGFYALGTGGLTGVGLGMSRQKYNYLPMAHNDFIFAVIGEELGLVGTLGMLAVFVLLLWAGLRIAQNAPDLLGKLIAAGATSLLVIQVLLNVSGVIGIFPLSGKPVPFISYGGSSVISSLMLAGLVVSVALHTPKDESGSAERRAKLRLAEEEIGAIEESTAGRATPRSARLAGGRYGTRAEQAGESLYTGEEDAPTTRDQAPRANLRLVEGGANRTNGRASVDERGRRRIDLGPSGAQRLRDRRSTQR